MATRPKYSLVQEIACTLATLQKEYMKKAMGKPTQSREWSPRSQKTVRRYCFGAYKIVGKLLPNIQFGFGLEFVIT